MKSLTVLFAFASIAAGASPAPVLRLSGNGSTAVELPRGWPLILSGLLLHSQASTKAEAPPLTIAPLGRAWADAIQIKVTGEDNTDQNWSFKLIGVPQDAVLELKQRSRAELEWHAPTEFTSVLPPGSYRIVARLEIAEGDGWKGAVVSPPLRVKVVEPPESLDETAQTNLALLNVRFALGQADAPAAHAALAQLLTAHPKSVRGLTGKAQLLAAEGKNVEARVAANDAVSAFFEKKPGEREPPEELLRLRRRLLIAAE